MRKRSPFEALTDTVRSWNEGELAEFELLPSDREREPIDIDLEQGVDIDLSRIDFSRGGLASYAGRQILLYIPDHGGNLETAMHDPSTGKRFHLTYCSTLQSMYAQNRFERYTATNNLSGEFTITGRRGWHHGRWHGKSRLLVCRNCLNKLNYKGWRHLRARDELVAKFSIAEFFETYSSFFPVMPHTFLDRQAGYSEDWEEVSRRVRQAAGWACQECRVDLRAHKRLLHAHHRNGVTRDNRMQNLQALCAACHRQQPHHQHMHVPHADTQTINRLRREQSINASGWAEAQEYADPAIHGALSVMRSQGWPAPVIGHDVQDDSGRVIAELEAAWPASKYALVIDTRLAHPPPGQVPGWRLRTVADILETESPPQQ